MNNKVGVTIAVTQLKWIRSALIALALGVAVLGVTGCKNSAPSESGAHAHQYTCSMHPEVVKDAPGDCPKCGMKLVEKH
ncbi:MAG: heavy metal-binding domain-containing protein [Limisphaerales bacterium]